METTAEFATLLRRTLLALCVCAGLVAVCYWFVDRPFATHVYEQKWNTHVLLKWLTYPPPIVQSWTPLVLAALAIGRAFGPFPRWAWVLLAASVGMIVADQFRQSLAYVFGQPWPDTWIDDNPSWIQNGVYGYYFFHGGEAYASFPSGHMSRTVAVAAVAWIAYPRWRWLCVLGSAAVAVGLLGMNYHFVSDVIAGTFVGGIVGTYAARCCGLKG